MGTPLETELSLPTAGAARNVVATWWRSAQGTTARNGTFALADQAVVSGTNFLTVVLVGRICGAEQLGIYALATTLLVLIVCAHQSLISTPYVIFGNRLHGRPRARYAGSVLLHSALLMMLMMAVLLAVGGVLRAGFGPAGLAPVVWVLVAVVPFTLLRDLARHFAFAHLKMRAALLLDVGVSALQIVGLFSLAAVGALSAKTAFFAMGASCAVIGVSWLIAGRKRFDFRLRQLREDLQKNWRFGRWVFAGMMVLMVHLSIVQWLVALRLGTAATGIFAACMAVVMLSNPFVQGVSNWLVPQAARAFGRAGERAVRRVVARTTLLVAVVMAAFSSVIFVFGGEIIALLYGSQYAGHRNIIAVLAVAMLARGLSMSAYNGLRVLERPATNFAVNLLGLAMTLFFAWLLMEPWGLLGAAVGLVAGDLIALVVRWIAFLKPVRKLA